MHNDKEQYIYINVTKHLIFVVADFKGTINKGGKISLAWCVNSTVLLVAFLVSVISDLLKIIKSGTCLSGPV